MWSSKPVPTEQPMPPSLYECALGLKSCTGPSSMRVDQLTLLNTWPLFVLIGLVGAVVLWVLYSPSHSPPPPRRPPMPKVSPKKDSDKEVDLAEPTRLIMLHTYLGYAYLIARGVVLDVIRLAVGLLPWNRAAAAKQAAAAPGAASVAPKVGPTFLTGWATLPLPLPLTLPLSLSLPLSLALTKVGPPFLTGWVVFYTRRLYQRIEDCWNRPIAGEASARIQVTLTLTLTLT